AETADQVARSGHFENTAADFVVAGANLVDDRLQGYMQCQQTIRIQFDLILSDESANRRNFGNSRNRLERVANLPILQTSQVGETKIVASIDQQILIYPSRPGRVGADDGMHATWEAALQLLHVLQHAAARPVDVGSIFKDHEHVRVVEHG